MKGDSGSAQVLKMKINGGNDNGFKLPFDSNLRKTLNPPMSGSEYKRYISFLLDSKQSEDGYDLNELQGTISDFHQIKL